MAPSPTPIAMGIPSVISCSPSECSTTKPYYQNLYTDSHSTVDMDDISVPSTDGSRCKSGVFLPPASPASPQQPTNYRRSQTVRVNVGGEDFSFPLAAFQRFLGLPWKCDSAGVYCLHSSAAVFEVLLDYTLFGTYPAYDTMSQEEFQEFETMALAMGGLTALIEHFDRKDSYWTKEIRRGGRRQSSPSSRHFLLNPEDGSCASPNSITATRCARWLGALCGVAETIVTRRRSPPPSPVRVVDTSSSWESGDSVQFDKSPSNE